MKNKLKKKRFIRLQLLAVLLSVTVGSVTLFNDPVSLKAAELTSSEISESVQTTDQSVAETMASSSTSATAESINQPSGKDDAKISSEDTAISEESLPGVPTLRAAAPFSAAEDAWIPEQQSIIKFEQAETNYLGGIALDAAGKVWTWGYNIHGMLGTNRPIVPATYAGGMERLDYFVKNNIEVVDIEAGYHTNYAVDINGVVYAWGRGNEGQMGNGTVTPNNPVPVVVTSLTGKKIVKISTSIEASSFTYAMDDKGNVYAWGYADDYRIPDKISYQSVASEVPSLSAIDIVDFDLGNKHGIVLDKEGRVYVWGSDAFGQIGDGSSTTPAVYPKEVAYFADKKVKQVSASFESNLVLTEDGKVFQWGQIYKTAAPVNVSLPEEVKIDSSSAGYMPQVASVTAGRMVNYFTDTNGRVWSWGYNTYYSWGTDGSLPSKLNHSVAVATQMPKTLGDGDTEGVINVPKAPVFSGHTYGQAYASFLSYQNHGQWSSIGDGLHPTIYDKKYSVTDKEPTGDSHTNVYLLNKQGERLVYVIKVDDDGTYHGNYYIAEDSYNGAWAVMLSNKELPAGVTSETSFPAIKESERGWIGLSVDIDTFDFTGNNLKEMPYVQSINTYQSSTLFLDPAGNLYKTGLDGSGTVAWGWDYSTYERGTAGNNAANGLYNMYTYEVMFMRGAPRMSAPSVTVDKPESKKYVSQDLSESVKLTIELDGAMHDEQLNISVEPELRETKYVVMPYDSSDENVVNSTPTKEDFMSAYNSGAYEKGDYIQKNPDWDLVHNLSEKPITLTDDSVTVKDNSVVWVYTETLAYTQKMSQVTRAVYDNFYTDAVITHNGMAYGQTDELYQKTSQNVTKVTKDKIADKVGFPLDTEGNIIGEPSQPPTYGYDEVSVSKFDEAVLPTFITSDETTIAKLKEQYRSDMLEKAEKDYTDSGAAWNKEIEDAYQAWVDTWFDDWFENEWLMRYASVWKWHEPQSSQKTYTLNGVDKTNNDDLTAATGELPVSESYTHTFYYTKDAAKFAQVHYLGVDREGDQLDQFRMSSEEVLKGVTYRRIPPDLLETLNVTAKKYMTQDGQPPTEFPLDLSVAAELGSAGEAEFMIPLGQDLNSELTVIFIYEPPNVHLNVRQVILNANYLIPLPDNGYLSVANVKLTDSQQAASSKNLISASGKSDTRVAFTPYILTKEKGYDGMLVSWITPQYYQYEGYVLTSEEDAHNLSGLVTSPEVKLDYTSTDAYWLTIYLSPTDETTGLFSWDSATNDFGTIKP